jgi:hypothetical protein
VSQATTTTARALRDAYRETFYPTDAARRSLVRLVVADLRHAAGAELATLAGDAAGVAGFHPDPRIEAYQAGKRALYFYLLRRAGMSDEECDRMNTQQETYLE